jgi:CYTH domain-containing protein
MTVEIERKFLIANEGWRTQGCPGVLLRQGYLVAMKNRIVRVRTSGGMRCAETGRYRREEFESLVGRPKRCLRMLWV